MGVYMKENGQLKKGAGLYKVSVPVGLADIYSTEEKEMGLWTDNKPLYQKTFKTTSPSVVNTSTDVVNLEGYNIAEITNMSAYIEVKSNITPLGGNSFILWHRRHTSNQNATIACQVSNSSYLSADLYITVQYTKTTDTPWSGKFVPQGYGYVSSGDIYSFEERQVGVFADGKPLYQKTVDLGALTANNNKTVLYADVGISDVEAVVYFDVMINNQVNSNYNRPDSVTKEFYTQIVPTGIFIRAYDTAITSAYATIQYTKTTDVAGSGEYVPSGDRAKHYTADEHIVGTWTDGSTLYEKTVRVAANATGAITLWTDASVVVKDYDGRFVFRSSENSLSLYSRLSDTAYRAELSGIGNNTNNGVYADITLGTSRTNTLDIELTVRYIKVSS